MVVNLPKVQKIDSIGNKCFLFPFMVSFSNRPGNTLFDILKVNETTCKFYFRYCVLRLYIRNVIKNCEDDESPQVLCPNILGNIAGGMYGISYS